MLLDREVIMLTSKKNRGWLASGYPPSGRIEMDEFPTIELPLSAGTRFDIYEIEEELGFLRIGSPTIVYRARDTQTQQQVAIKIFSLRYEQTYADEKMLARFTREVEI